MARAELIFEPRGSHSSGADISGAVILVRPAGATQIMMQALTQNVRFTLDGTNPTTGLGFQIKAGDPPMIIPVGSSATLKVVQETATASLQFQWGGQGV